MWRQIVLFVSLFCQFGCAGQVEQEPDGSAGSGGGAVNATSAKSRLGSCTPGTSRNQATECLWTADSICYPTKEAACNCICPTNVATVYCESDFPEDGVPTEVYCS
jgi:hypothetical protein